MLDPGRFCSTAQPGVTVAALQVMMTAPVQSAGVALDDREAVVDEAVRQESFSAGRIVLEVVPAAGSDGFAGVARRHAGAPCRARGAPRSGAFAVAGGRKSDGAAENRRGAPVF